MKESNMSDEAPAPVPRFTVITLGVADMRKSIAFYETLGFARKFRGTGEVVAFFDTGGTVIGLSDYFRGISSRPTSHCRKTPGRRPFAA
jgi:catechol 2,3-dioxygenase-like lactoylglutathione lyase family enzyme